MLSSTDNEVSMISIVDVNNKQQRTKNMQILEEPQMKQVEYQILSCSHEHIEFSTKIVHQTSQNAWVDIIVPQLM